MRRLALLIALAGCEPSTGRLRVQVSADPEFASDFLTEDGWNLKFKVAVVALGSWKVNDAFKGKVTDPKLITFTNALPAQLAYNGGAYATTYPSISAWVEQRAGTPSVTQDGTGVEGLGSSSVWLEGVASKQSTARSFVLSTASTFSFENCKPVATVEPGKEALVDFRFHLQRVFEDDEGKMRFDAWGLSDALPQDGKVSVFEAGLVMTSTLPPAQYGATQGSLMVVFEKRLTTVLGLGDSGPCSGR